MIITNKLKKNNSIKFILLSLLTLFCLQRLIFSSYNIIDGFVSYFTYPIIAFQGKITDSINSYYKNNLSADQLNKKIKILQDENENLLAENIRLKTSLNYLERVGELIEFRKKYEIDSSLSAQIIMKQISDQGHYCFIDKGSFAGVKQNMVAIYKNCIIGRVGEVYPTYSKLIYITDKSCKVTAYCFKTGTVGIYEGTNQLNYSELNYVNHLEKVEEDDLVISNGEGLIFPQGFALGKITKFSNDGIQYKIILKPIIDVSQIKYCHLILR